MEIKKKDFLPDAGELVVTTIARVVPYGAYATLDEYNDVEGLLHISEVSSRWVKNIRNHVRERQKTVLKVLRVDPDKRHIDLSLRRVNKREKREKIIKWKQDRKARRLFEITADKLGVNKEKAYEKVGYLLEDHFGSLYSGLMTARIKGEKALSKAKIPAKWSKVLSEVAKSMIKISRVKIKGILELTCSKPNGVIILKDAFKKAKNIEKLGNTEIRFFVMGAPKYRIEVLSNNYKEAEKILKKAASTVIEAVKASDGEGSFTRKLSG